MAKTAAKYLTASFLDYGVPLKLLSNPDPSYKFGLFQQFMNNLVIKKLRSTGYRPSSNELTGRSNTTTKNYLTMF